MPKQPSRFKETCARGLSHYPNKPCPLALESIEAMRNGTPEKVSCQWYVNHVDSQYCYHKFENDEMEPEGIDSNRKISHLLVLNDKEINVALLSAVDKLKALGEEAQLWAEAVTEKDQYFDNSIYSDTPWFTEVTGKTYDEVTPEMLDPGKPGRKKKNGGMGPTPKGHSGAGAIHKDGKKVQIHSLSSNWSKHIKAFQEGPTPIRMAENTMGKKKDKKKKEDEGKSNK